MGTVSFEVPGPGTYQVTCDPKLDTLANSGTAGDVLAGKQFYNDQNAPVTGTMPNNPPQQVSVAGGESYTIPRGYHDGTGRVTGTGAALPALTNPGEPGDLLKDKQLIDQNGNVVTGTLEPGSSTSDATATAGDILAPKTAYVAAGKVTGTIATRGDSDVTASGPQVAVPAGYYPQAVNKTVSDPNLIPENIKAGVDILGITGALSPEYAGVLVVTVDAGAVVTATDGTTTLTQTSTGTATFQLPKGGTWTVSATLNGNHSPPETVDVQETFPLTLSPGGTASVRVPNQYETQLSFLPTYTVTLTIDPAGSGTVTGAGEYREGTQVTVTANPEEGYEFAAWKESGVSRLPNGYTELEYIEINNRTRIPTGYTVTHPLQTRIVMDMTPLEKVSLYRYLFSALSTSPISTMPAIMLRQDNASNRMFWFAGFNAVENTSQKGTFTYNMAANTRITAEMDLASKKVKMGSSSFTITPLSTMNGASCGQLFIGTTSAANDDTSDYSLHMNLYSFQVYENEELVRDMVPCKDSNGVVGMYDMVAGVFKTGYLTGSLADAVAGPEVSTDTTVSKDPEYTFTVDRNVALVAVFAVKSRLPEGYTELEYISTDGYARIPTGILATIDTTRIVMDIIPTEHRTIRAYFFDALNYYSSSYTYGFGLRNNESDGSMNWFSGYWGSSSGGYSAFNYSFDYGKRITIDMDSPSKTLKIGDTTIPISPATNTSVKNAGALNFGGWYPDDNIAYTQRMDIYSAQVYLAGILKGDFVPCTKDDGAIGLYNLVDHVFYGASHGTLTPGPAV